MAAPSDTNTTKQNWSLADDQERQIRKQILIRGFREHSLITDDPKRKRMYKEYGVGDLNSMKKEDIDRVVDFISAKPEERKIRNSNVQSVPELKNLAYKWLNEMLLMLDPSNNTISLYQCKHLQGLVTKLRCVSFEGSWLDEIEKVSKTMEIELFQQEELQNSCAQFERTLQSIIDKKKQAEEKLAGVLERKKESVENFNKMKQNIMFH